MYATDLSIREFRCIAKADIAFLHPGSPDADKLELPNINLLTGLNGGGKSTVLKALVAASLGKMIGETGFDPTGWIRRGAKGDAQFRVNLLCHAIDGVHSAGSELDLEFLRPMQLAARVVRGKQQKLVPERDGRDAGMPAANDVRSGFFFAAYGPSRHASDATDEVRRAWISGPRLQRVASLLDERVTLQRLEDWLPEVEAKTPDRFEEIKKLIAVTIPPSTRFEGKREDGAYLFEHDGVAVPYGALSEGLRSHIAWIADLLYHLNVATPAGMQLDALPGLVLVDEIDQRLHPRWQLDILSWISAAFERLQFVVTSHSPLLAGGLRPRNIAVLESHKDANGVGASRPRNIVEDVFGRSADGVLTSSYFDLTSTRADPFRKHLRDLIRLVRDGDEDAPLQLMRVLGDPRKMKSLDAKDTKRRGGPRR